MGNKVEIASRSKSMDGINQHTLGNDRLANIPIDLLSSIVFTPIVFYMIGFNDSNGDVFGGFVGILVLITLLSTALGYWVRCTANIATDTHRYCIMTHFLTPANI